MTRFASVSDKQFVSELNRLRQSLIRKSKQPDGALKYRPEKYATALARELKCAPGRVEALMGVLRRMEYIYKTGKSRGTFKYFIDCTSSAVTVEAYRVYYDSLAYGKPRRRLGSNEARSAAKRQTST